MTVHLGSARANTNSISALQDHQGPVESLFRVPSSVNELAAESGETGAPADGKSALQFVFDLADLFHHLLAALALALSDCVHG